MIIKGILVEVINITEGTMIMINKKLVITVIMMGMMNVSFTIDIRKAWSEFSHNKQDENGNTFWHNLVKKAEISEDWSEVNREIELFMSNNKNWMPNPTIRNDRNNTARKEAKISFEKNGNAVVGLLAIYLRNSENQFLNQVALKNNRESMNFAQYLDCEVAKKLSLDQMRLLVEQQNNKKNI